MTSREREPVWAVGLMTGTVLDGNIDVALLLTDGESIIDYGAFALVPYSAKLIHLLETTLQQARSWQFVGPEPPSFASAEQQLTIAQAEAVRRVVREAGFTLKDIGIIGFHGQTVLHRPPTPGRIGRTRQLGDGERMAALLERPVAYDFRTADVAAGGQGAPLSAVYHQARLRTLPDPLNSAVLNLGGVANLTWWDGQDQLVAFDTGPANAPLNDFIQQRGAGRMDLDGRLAASGRVDECRLARLLQHSYFLKRFPKSLDRFDFSAAIASDLSLEDGAALLTAFVGASIGVALDLLPTRPRQLIVCGGGRRNPTMLQAITQRAGIKTVPAEQVGWRSEAVEAECFAYLAVRTWFGLPISFPGTTGVPAPMSGGRIAPAAT